MKQIKLYIMSLWILFVLVLVATLNIPVSFDSNATFVGWKMLLSINNVVAFLCILFILMGLLFYYQFNYRLKGAPNGLPIMITKIENINYEYVSLFMTLLSVIAFDFNTFRGAILFFLVLLILGAIFIKTELFYSNPSFALLGFYIYRVETGHMDIISNGSILIARGKIKCRDKVNYIKISETVFYCQKSKIRNK